MPRKKRFYVPDIPVHVVQRGNNRDPVFFNTGDYQHYLTWLKEASLRYHCAIHSYVLMTNHIHLLVSPSSKDSISYMMQYLGRHYVPYINSHYRQSGTLWEGRYKGNLVQDDTYLLTCMRYIELNPVRACLVPNASDYLWSSFAVNRGEKNDDIITPHQTYLALGANQGSRQLAYKALFDTAMESNAVKEIRAALQTGTPLGNSSFREKIEQTLEVKVGQFKRGRPRK